MVEVVDADGAVTAIVSRDEIRARNLWHRTAFVIVRSIDGAILAHRRALTKKYSPGLWDLGFGGAAAAGEPYELAAARELAEEAGISTPLRFVSDYVYEDADTRERGKLFETVSDGPFQHPSEEVSETAFVRPEDLDAFVASHPTCQAALDVMVDMLRG